VAKGGALALKIKKIQDEGKLVSSELVVELLAKYIVGVPGIHLLDGFPRNFENLDTWNKKLFNDVETKGMIFFDCSEEEMIKRV
jgi:adenylate kinase family enzyme